MSDENEWITIPAWLKNGSAAPTCAYCDDEKEIEMDNNGPIVPCPVCCPKHQPKAQATESTIEQVGE